MTMMFVPSQVWLAALALLLLADDVSSYHGADPLLSEECNHRVWERTNGLSLDVCCSSYLRYHCVSALCHTAKFRDTSECVGDHLYKELISRYRTQCSYLTDFNFATECSGLDAHKVNDWSDVTTAASVNRVAFKHIAMTIAAVIAVLLIVVALIWIAVWWFCWSKPKNSRERSESSRLIKTGGTGKSRQRSRSPSGKSRRSPSIKSKRSNNQRRGSKGRRSSSRNRVNQQQQKEQQQQQQQQQSSRGSFNSRAVTSRKSSRKGKSKPRVNLKFTAFKKALA